MLWDLAGNIKRSKTFVSLRLLGTLESFARQDYLILRERISDKESRGGSLYGTGFGKILNLGFGLNRLPVSGGFLVVRAKRTFWNWQVWLCPQNSFRKILGARVNSRLLIRSQQQLDTVQRRGVITPLLWTLGAGTDCPEEGGKRGVSRQNCLPMPFLQITPLIPLSSGHSVPALTVQRRGVITPLLWTVSGTKTSKSADFQNVPFSICRQKNEQHFSVSALMVQRGLEFALLLWTFGAGTECSGERGSVDRLLLDPRLLGIKTQIPYFQNAPSCGAILLRSRARGKIEALPKRVPNGPSPLNSLLNKKCNIVCSVTM